MVTRRLIVPKPILLLEFQQLPVISNLFEEIARLDILAGQPHVRKEWGRNGEGMVRCWAVVQPLRFDSSKI
jgi:hypothetical protein